MDIVWVSFDCYGTLINWEAGIRAYFAGLLKKKGLEADVEALVAQWEPIQFQMIQRPWQPYRQILFQSLYETFLRARIPWMPSDSIGFGKAMETWEPFPEVPEALRRLGKRKKIAILSNVDDDIITKTLDRIGVPIDTVVTAEQVQSYKPGDAHFTVGQRRMGVPPSMILHAAFGWDYDIGPAQAAGFHTCFVNRSGRVPPKPTDFVVKDLDELARVI